MSSHLRLAQAHSSADTWRMVAERRCWWQSSHWRGEGLGWHRSETGLCGQRCTVGKCRRQWQSSYWRGEANGTKDHKLSGVRLLLEPSRACCALLHGTSINLASKSGKQTAAARLGLGLTRCTTYATKPAGSCGASHI